MTIASTSNFPTFKIQPRGRSMEAFKDLQQLCRQIEKLRDELYKKINQLDSGGIGSVYTDENAQDAVGGILTNSATIGFVYDDASNTISADFLAIENRTSDPSSPITGQIWLRTDL